MALQDHFHPPLKLHRYWHGFHNGWASNIAAALNRYLPEGYFAQPNVMFGIEIDVAAFEETRLLISPQPAMTGASAAPSLAWAPPPPTQIVPFQPATDLVEVNIFNTAAGPELVGAIELVSPGNKDRPTNREAFASKCENYLHQGVGLVIVDIVTERAANLHNEILARLTRSTSSGFVASLSATAYRVVERDGQPSLDIWEQTLTVGQPLPTMPLWLRGNMCLPVELNATYERTCEEQKITAA
jgi:hypothetical protein